MHASTSFTTGLAFLSALSVLPAAASANENVVGRPDAEEAITTEDVQAAQVRPGRFFTDPGLLSDHVRGVIGIAKPDPDDEGEEALPVTPFNGMSHPFTTKNASGEGGVSPVEEFPWRAVGKLFMKIGGSTAHCTGSVIGTSLVVTAAHCVHDFGLGEDGFADTVSFEPARHGSSVPFGTWVAKEWWIPKAYFDGTDVCSADAPGVVCENDVAVVVLEKNDGQSVADLTGKFGFQSDDYGYGNFLGNLAAQITQLGYPVENYDGFTMVRTDSLGYQDEPNNVIIGSAQTGGASGSPLVQNFGMKTSYTGTPPLANDDNQVVGTTSWGFVSGVFMIQGASRFGKNTIYTEKSNIQSLVDSACEANPDAC